MNSYFGPYKVHADIRGRSVARGLEWLSGGQNRRLFVISITIC